MLAHFGFGSRREIERWIEDGRITVDGELAELGQQVNLRSRITLDGNLIKLDKLAQRQKSKLLIYHKPTGEVCSRHDPDGRPTVFDALPRCSHGRWIMVGRLDVNTSGLLLFTNDGEFAHKLMHPSSQVEREYAVRIMGDVSDAMLQRLKAGVMLEDGPAHFDHIEAKPGGTGKNRWYHVILHEGRHREVRRLWESQGVTVSRLIRVRFGEYELPHSLPRGRYCYIDV